MLKTNRFRRARLPAMLAACLFLAGCETQLGAPRTPPEQDTSAPPPWLAPAAPSAAPRQP